MGNELPILPLGRDFTTKGAKKLGLTVGYARGRYRGGIRFRVGNELPTLLLASRYLGSRDGDSQV